MDFLFNNHNTNPFLSIYTVGYEQTSPKHNYGPAVRSGYMLHFVYSGQGTYTCNGNSYTLKAGDFFFISPDATIQYTSDTTNPWSYYWFGFRGELAEYYLKETAVDSNNPVFSVNTKGRRIKQLMSKLIEISLISEDNDMLLNATLLEILYQLSLIFPSKKTNSKQSKTNLIVAKALAFMKNNYDNPIYIADISNHLNIDRTYLHRLFVKEVGQSPKQMLTNIRLEKAIQLLLESDLSIKNIAYSTGFDDPAGFSKVFKQHFNMTPSQYRNHS